MSRGANSRPGSPISCTACICSGLIFFLTHKNLRLPVKSLVRRASSRSGKITTNFLAAAAGSIKFLGCAYRACVSKFVASKLPCRSTMSARLAEITAPGACARGSSGSDVATKPIRAPTTAKAQKKNTPRTKSRPSARRREWSRICSWRIRVFSRSIASGFSPR